jgi:hypothetical protein
MSDLETRQQLLAAAERHEQELEHALVDLERAVKRPFALGEQLGKRIGTHPWPWLLASVLTGLWLGSRNR